MPVRRVPPPFRLSTLVAACCVASTAHAAPLSHVQKVGPDDVGPAGIDRITRFALGDERLFGASTQTILHLERDPATGRLGFVEEIVAFEPGSPVPAEGDLRPLGALTALPGDRLVVSTQSRIAQSCPDRPTTECTLIGTTTFAIDDGRLNAIESNDVGGLIRPMVSSPDGRHVYAPDGTPLVALVVDDDGQLREVERYATFRADGTPSQVRDMVFSSDGTLLFALLTSGDSLNRRLTITTLARDAATGLLTPVADTEVGDGTLGPAQSVRNAIAVSPDGTAIYAGSRSFSDDVPSGVGGFAGSGLARYDVSAAGIVTLAGLETTVEGLVPNISSNLGPVAVGAGGRLVAIGNDTTDVSRQALHLFTVDDAGDTRYRGFETGGRDGVLGGDLASIKQVEFSDDGAFLYVFADAPGSGIGLNVFAAHADLQVGIETPTNALAGGEVGATVRLTNAGPATSHGLTATIEASGEILGADGDCDIDGATATCRVDELLARGATDFAVRVRAPEEGEATLSVTASQYQTDLDASSNAASAAVAVVADAGAVTGATTTVGAGTSAPAVDDGGEPADASGENPGVVAGDGSGDGGGGCSISTGDGSGSLAAWLLALPLLALRRRARRTANGGTPLSS